MIRPETFVLTVSCTTTHALFTLTYLLRHLDDDTPVLGDVTALEIKLWTYFAVLVTCVNSVLYVATLWPSLCTDLWAFLGRGLCDRRSSVSACYSPIDKPEKINEYLRTETHSGETSVKDPFECRVQWSSNTIPGSLPVVYTSSPNSPNSPLTPSSHASSSPCIDAASAPQQSHIYDRQALRALRFQHDARRVTFPGVLHFAPFARREDIGLYMDVKIQKFPMQRFAGAAQFDAFVTEIVATVGPILGFKQRKAPRTDPIGNLDNAKGDAEDEYVFVGNDGVGSHLKHENGPHKCPHCHAQTDLGTSTDDYTSVRIMSPGLGLHHHNSSSFPYAADLYSPPVVEGLGVAGLLDREESVLLTISLARLRAALRGVCADLESLPKKKADCSHKEAVRRRRVLTCLGLKCVLSGGRLFAAFAESRNASLSALHFFVDLLAFGAPEAIYSSPAGPRSCDGCACGLCKGHEGDKTEEPPQTGGTADSPITPDSLRTQGASPTFVPSTNVQLLKLVYDFYILRLHQTRRAHYQSLQRAPYYPPGAASSTASTNSYDEPTYRYIMLLRSMLDTVSAVLCLQLPQGPRDAAVVLRFAHNIWAQAHLSKSAKNSSVYMLFVAMALVHRNVLKASAALEAQFVDICARALQYRVTDVRLHVRRNYWLVRTIHPDLHDKIQHAIKESNKRRL